MMNLFKHPLSLSLSYFLLRMLFIPLSPVPAAVALDPLWVFAVLLYAKGGKLWVLSLVPGLLLGDVLGGLPWSQLMMRTAGFLLLAHLPVKGGFHRQCLFWITQHGLWSAVMPDWLGLYPLGYIYTIWMLQGILWWGILVPKQASDNSEPWWPLLLTPALLLIAHLFFVAPGLWPVPQLGSHSGWTIRILGGLLLLPPLAGYVSGRKASGGQRLSGKPRGRWTHLAE
jgi:hypothetical protein